MSEINRLRIDATLIAKSETRYTPAGLAVQEVQLKFVGTVNEADAERSLDFEFDAVAVGAVALQLGREALGTNLQLDGFVAPRSKRSHRLRVHVTQYKLNLEN